VMASKPAVWAETAEARASRARAEVRKAIMGIGIIFKMLLISKVSF
jgi:hypothetical protein